MDKLSIKNWTYNYLWISPIFAPEIWPKLLFLGLFPANFVTKEVKNETSNVENGQPQAAAENKKIVITVDEALLDATLDAVESADPSLLDDPQEMRDNEDRCSKMGTRFRKK